MFSQTLDFAVGFGLPFQKFNKYFSGVGVKNSKNTFLGTDNPVLENSTHIIRRLSFISTIPEPFFLLAIIS